MKNDKLTKLISESIKKHLTEAYKPASYIDGIDSIISDVKAKINKYETYAEQLRNEIAVVQQLCASASLSIGSKFNISSKLYNCRLENDELSFNVVIPIAKFVEVCKQDENVMKLFQETGGKTEQDLIECGISNDYWADDMYVGDKHHGFEFRAVKVQGDFVVCTGIISGAFVNYD